MSYTLAMASDLEPRIADDGVQEVPLTRARALLTRLIEQAREDDLVSSFTVRGRRRAYVVTPDFYVRALLDRAQLEDMERRVRELEADDSHEARLKRRTIGETLQSSKRHAAEIVADD